MAKGAIINFFDAAMTDQELHQKLTELAERFAGLAEEYGYDFTAEELLEFGTVQPLFDDDVERVGGAVTPIRLLTPTPFPRTWQKGKSATLS